MATVIKRKTRRPLSLLLTPFSTVRTKNQNSRYLPPHYCGENTCCNRCRTRALIVTEKWGETRAIGGSLKKSHLELKPMFSATKKMRVIGVEQGVLLAATTSGKPERSADLFPKKDCTPTCLG